MKNIIFVSFLLCFFQLGVQAQLSLSELQKGVDWYDKERYDMAESLFEKAYKSNRDFKTEYNYANSLYKNGKVDEAITRYQNVVDSAYDNSIRSKAFHNLGNAHYQKQEYDKSVDAYKNSLRINPNDLETKKNLLQAMQQLRQQEEQQEQEQQENQDGEKGEESENQPQDGENQNQDQGQQQDSQQDQEQEEQQNSQGEDQDGKSGEEQDMNLEESQKMSEKEAERILKAIEKKEEGVMNRIKYAKPDENKTKKDW